MAITYKVVKVKNPKGADGVDFYAGRAVKTSDYSRDGAMEKKERIPSHGVPSLV